LILLTRPFRFTQDSYSGSEYTESTFTGVTQGASNPSYVAPPPQQRGPAVQQQQRGGR
jgi:hypothetical protein